AFSPSSLVVMSNAREVQALLIEMSTEPSHAPSMRTWATRLPPASTTATFMGWPISSALASAAAITRRASASVSAVMAGLPVGGGWADPARVPVPAATTRRGDYHHPGAGTLLLG